MKICFKELLYSTVQVVGSKLPIKLPPGPIKTRLENWCAATEYYACVPCIFLKSYNSVFTADKIMCCSSVNISWYLIIYPCHKITTKHLSFLFSQGLTYVTQRHAFTSLPYIQCSRNWELVHDQSPTLWSLFLLSPLITWFRKICAI